MISRLILVLALTVFAIGQEVKKPSDTIKGFLIDNMCVEAADAEEIEGHLVSCALIETCIKSGFAVVSEGKVYKLDEKGNKLAVKVLKATRARMGLVVAVGGTLDGDTLRAETLTESTLNTR